MYIYIRYFLNLQTKQIITYRLLYNYGHTLGGIKIAAIVVVPNIHKCYIYLCNLLNSVCTENI